MGLSHIPDLFNSISLAELGGNSWLEGDIRAFLKGFATLEGCWKAVVAEDLEHFLEGSGNGSQTWLKTKLAQEEDLKRVEGNR